MKTLEYSELFKNKLNVVYEDKTIAYIQSTGTQAVYSPVFGKVMFAGKSTPHRYNVIIECNIDNGLIINGLVELNVQTGDSISLSQQLGTTYGTLFVSTINREKSSSPVRVPGYDDLWYKHNPLKLLDGTYTPAPQHTNNINNLNVYILSDQVSGNYDTADTLSQVSRNTLSNNKGDKTR